MNNNNLQQNKNNLTFFCVLLDFIGFCVYIVYITLINLTKKNMNYDILILLTFAPAFFFMHKSMTEKKIDLFKDVSEKKFDTK